MPITAFVSIDRIITIIVIIIITMPETFNYFTLSSNTFKLALIDVIYSRILIKITVLVSRIRKVHVDGFNTHIFPGN